MSYVLMRVLESAPRRYDRGIRILTLGRLELAMQDIAVQVKRGQKILDIGSGTGALAVLLAQRGAHVVGIDISPTMLCLARERALKLGIAHHIAFREIGAIELDTAFADEHFDAVTSLLTFSELSKDEIRYSLHQCNRLLKPDGTIFITDEILLESLLGRVLTFLFRLPFALLAFVLTQNTTHRVAGLERHIADAGFKIVEVRHYLFRTLRTVIAEKGPSS